MDKYNDLKNFIDNFVDNIEKISSYKNSGEKDSILEIEKELSQLKSFADQKLFSKKKSKIT